MPRAAAPPAEKMSMAERAYEALRHRLILLDIAPGQPLNEAALSAELEVGRTPIREALKRLESDHLVTTYPRRGTFASTVDLTDLSEIFEMRIVLEPMAAKKAAAGLTAGQRSDFHEAIDHLRALGETDEQRTLIEHDLYVHRLIYHAAGNRHLQETLVRLDDLATRIWCLALPRIPDLAEHVQEHVALLEAILGGDQQAVAKIAAEHVREFDKALRAAFH